MIIAANIIATADFNILTRDLRSTEGAGVVTIPSTYTADFFFADSQPLAASTGHRIKRVLFAGKDRSGSSLALLEIEGHDTAANPPLQIELESVRESREGNFVFVVGFPQRDARLPEPFVRALLGPPGGGKKRAMPGKIIQLPSRQPTTPFSLTGDQAIKVDSSTLVGTSGGPLIDLHSGKVIGVHVAGQWNDVREGKFAYALPLARGFEEDKVRERIRLSALTITCDPVVTVRGLYSTAALSVLFNEGLRSSGSANLFVTRFSARQIL